jgi:nucleotide-binding universal stress UspA family protein
MFEKIMLFVERSEETLKAARVTIDIARALGSRLIAVHVIDPAAVNQLASFSGKSPDEVTIELEEDGWRFLYNIEEEAVSKGVKITIDLEEGRPTEKIIQLATRFDVDLLVYGNPKERGTRAMKTVKAVEELITHASCPVLIV